MGHNCNRFILSAARERATQNRDIIPMGASRGYVVKNEGSRKQRHDGVVTCYEIRGKLDRKTVESGKRQLCGLLAKITTQYEAGEKTSRNRRHGRFAAHVRKRGELNQ